MRTELILPGTEMMHTAPGEPRETALADTESVCPVCLAQVRAERQQCGAEVNLVKTCREHGTFRSLIWRGEPALSTWIRSKVPCFPILSYSKTEHGCPFDCGLCPLHEQHTCTMLLEITQRCNLRCPVCFASAGGKGAHTDLSLEEATILYERIMAASGPCNIQLSGGEPTLHSQLLDIIRQGRNKGFSFIQLNTNGLRLAETADYAKMLREAGLSSVFLQFDGLREKSHQALRGRDLRHIKELAIRHCGAAGLGVVLVPTLIPGVNTEELGAIIAFGVQHAPTVRGVHFQPVSYFGRYPDYAQVEDRRLTLPELLQLLQEQGDGALLVEHFAPPACEHALCSAHASYIISEEGSLLPVGAGQSACCSSELPQQGFPTALEGKQKSVAFTARQWGPAPPELSGAPVQNEQDLDDFDRFLARARSYKFSISAMFFQDAWNLDLERLRGCCIHVAAPDGRIIPFCAYNLSAKDGTTLYRGKKFP